MKPHYTLNRDKSVQWIGLPNNGGELGPDLDDIVKELNRLHQELSRLQHERDSAPTREPNIFTNQTNDTTTKRS